jgi:FKBP-type peptidyl-prolyl cis-trans isomerase
MPERFDPDGEVILHIRLFSFVGKQKIDRERQAYSNQSKLDEQKELDDYLSENQINAEAKDGIYVTITQNGAGAPLRNEQKVTVNYTGKFLSGQIFDSSYDRNEAYTFTLGVGEVIPAWDNGLKNAHIGDKLQIISPSAQAYGAEGSEGYIPPFTTLLFEIEILDAK